MTAPSRPRRPVVPAVPRLQARARQERGARRRRRIRRLALALAVALPLAAAGWVLLVSPLLAVRTVAVTGTSRVSVAQVRLAVGVPAGTPLARVDLAGVAARVRALPPVAEVQVRRSWPHTLLVHVVERTAVAVAGAGGQARLVDAAGVPFAAAPAAPPGLVHLEVGHPGPADPATRAALQVLTRLPAGLRAQLSAVRAPSPAGVTLVLRDGRTVLWGTPGDTAAKAEALTALLRMPGRVFDVSQPGVVTRR